MTTLLSAFVGGIVEGLGFVESKNNFQSLSI